MNEALLRTSSDVRDIADRVDVRTFSTGESLAFEGLPASGASPSALNAYTEYIYNEGVRAWKALEEKYWIQFGSGF